MTVDEIITELMALHRRGYGDKNVYVQDSEFGTLDVNSVIVFDNDVYIDTE